MASNLGIINDLIKVQQKRVQKLRNDEETKHIIIPSYRAEAKLLADLVKTRALIEKVENAPESEVIKEFVKEEIQKTPKSATAIADMLSETEEKEENQPQQAPDLVKPVKPTTGAHPLEPVSQQLNADGSVQIITADAEPD